MTWLLPWALGAAAAAAFGITLLHLLARDRPERWILPTARFVAAGRARAVRAARTPRDLLLLALRVLALVLAGAAFAAPALHPDGGAVATVVVLDLTGRGDGGALVDSARARLADGDRLVVLDSAAHVVTAGAEPATLDSLGQVVAGGGGRSDSGRIATEPATFTAAFVAAVRAAAMLEPSADSAALVIVSPFAGGLDAATADARALWPGRAELLQVTDAASRDSITGRATYVRGPAGDAVVAGARLAGARPAPPTPAGERDALVVRGALTAADSAFARAGGTVLHWPVDTAAAGFESRTRRDTASGFVAGDHAVLFRAVRTHLPPPGRTVARWVDGAPAVTEASVAAGCIRTAVIPLPVAGDLTLRPAFGAALASLAGPCDGHRAPLAEGERAMLAGPGGLARANELRETSTRSPATPWLLVAALALLCVEPLLRRRGTGESEVAA